MSALPGWVSVADYMTPVSGVPDDATCAANTKGLTEAVAAVQAKAGGTLYFPPGRWPITKAVSQFYGVKLQDAVNLRFLGDQGAILALAGNQGNTDAYLLQLVNTRGLRFENLSFSQRDALHCNEQTHEVQLGGSGGLALLNDDVQFIGCHFIEGAVGAGDGVRILGGDVQNKQTRAVFDRCVFEGLTRSGISVQRGSWDINVSNCYFANITTKQGIHFEPSGQVDVGRWRIVNNHFEACEASLVGTDGTHQDKYSLFANNTINNNTLFLQYCKGAIVTNNHIVADDASVSDALLLLYSNCEDVQIRNNYLSRGPHCVAASTLEIDYHGTLGPDKIVIDGNIVHQFTNASLCECESVKHLEVTRNRFIYHGSATNISGVYLQSHAASPDLYFAGNYVESERQADGIKPAGTLTSLVNIESGFGGVVGQVVVINNRGVRVEVGLRDQNAPAAHTNGIPLVTGNVLDSTATGVVGGTGNLLTYWGVAGTPGLLGILQGTIDPEGVIPSQQGSTYQRLNGDASALYFKRTGTGKTGWVALTVP